MSAVPARPASETDLEALNDYSGTMRGYLSEYDELRSATDDWSHRVDAEGSTFDEAYQFLGDGLAARQNLLDSVRSLSAPPGVEGYHSQIESVFGDSVRAMGDAYPGLVSYELDYAYGDYHQTPGWQQFESTSSEISSEFASAQAGWEDAVSSREAAIEDRPLPKRPAV